MTVVALAVGLALVILAVGVAAAGAALVARHRAQVAADAAALAGAAHTIEGIAASCAEAARVVVANGGTMVHCRLDGWDVVVTAAVRPAGPVAALGTATASARAGPAEATAGPRRR